MNENTRPIFVSNARKRQRPRKSECRSEQREPNGKGHERPHNSAGSSERGTEAGPAQQPFEGLCRFRNELIHEDGMDLLGIRGSVPPRPWRVVPRLDFLFPTPRSIWPAFSTIALSLELAEERDGRTNRARS